MSNSYGIESQRTPVKSSHWGVKSETSLKPPVLVASKKGHGHHFIPLKSSQNSSDCQRRIRIPFNLQKKSWHVMAICKPVPLYDFVISHIFWRTTRPFGLAVQMAAQSRDQLRSPGTGDPGDPEDPDPVGQLAKMGSTSQIRPHRFGGEGVLIAGQNSNTKCSMTFVNIAVAISALAGGAKNGFAPRPEYGGVFDIFRGFLGV